MQSFLTVFVAGTLAFIGVFMMNPEPESRSEIYAETEPQFVLSDVPDIPTVLVEPIQPLVLALDAYQQFDSGIYLEADVLLAFDE
ncbi:MAG: hypothetical protein AAF437_12560 [Pseudomonadota bacterium]